MPSFSVRTATRDYEAIVERGILARAGEFVPSRIGTAFILTTRDVWQLHGERLEAALGGRKRELLFFTGGEEHKRLAEVERLADEMVARGGERSSLLIAFGGGIANDVGGFLASVFMRGIPVVQIPTTLLAQVDAAVGGKTGVDLRDGKNLVGTFHQPLAVLIDPDVLATLPAREYTAGLFEVLKCGIIRGPELFRLMTERAGAVRERAPEAVERMIAESVRIKAEVVSADEREGDLRRILNFGHTVGHALEAETGYSRFLHGEAVAVGMRAAAHLGRLAGVCDAATCDAVVSAVGLYGPLPSLEGVRAPNLAARLRGDKKTMHGKVHFVLPERIGAVRIVSGLPEQMVLEAMEASLA
ncbi:MAG: 3-dehydroquinate synthase [Acidobacteria bacterium]|nr:3-dehydroquinate synthase [Acidobacteriota bacterium]